MKRSSWVISTLLLLIVGAVSFRFYQIQSAASDVRDIRELPRQIGEWRAEDLEVTERAYEILETRNLISREYRNPKGETLNLFVIYSETNRRVCHPPVVCLIGSGATVTRDAKGTLSLSDRTIPVNHLVVESAGQSKLVLYWYMLGKEFTEDYFTQQFRWVLAQATGKGPGGALVRIIAPMSGSEEETLEGLSRFVRDLLPYLTEERTG